ncbi:hypothetical protein SAMN05216302_102519 [Nitrosomonas aestuarii]|uniref:Uncharacterized protein n=1 Tax=Nitrosomonas aestuarii TaxID=52441 RepID=A0A1I4E638_9PROT|nr:hypothetical protein C8R11_10481 [Nitrosomonas aestuarii]SFK99641.1 hypothetical protein SAMN05216302_102519 [Nitrosomonas aestuarii]
MPTLRFKIITLKKPAKAAKQNNILKSFFQTLKNSFNKLINSDSLPYIMAPLIFLGMMYLEWLYLCLL